MAKRENRRDQIIDTASQMFMQNGYVSTSIRQIADEVGVTEAAIYYHFKDKRDLFEVVLEREMPDPAVVLEHCKDANTLKEFMQGIGKGMEREIQCNTDRFRWIGTEFNQFTDEERLMINRMHMTFHQTMMELVEQFIDDEDMIRSFSWLTVCAFFGYAQLFWNFGLNGMIDYKASEIGNLLAVLAEHIPDKNLS